MVLQEDEWEVNGGTASGTINQGRGGKQWGSGEKSLLNHYCTPTFGQDLPTFVVLNARSQRV